MWLCSLAGPSLSMRTVLQKVPNCHLFMMARHAIVFLLVPVSYVSWHELACLFIEDCHNTTFWKVEQSVDRQAFLGQLRRQIW